MSAPILKEEAQPRTVYGLNTNTSSKIVPMMATWSATPKMAVVVHQIVTPIKITRPGKTSLFMSTQKTPMKPFYWLDGPALIGSCLFSLYSHCLVFSYFG